MAKASVATWRRRPMKNVNFKVEFGQRRYFPMVEMSGPISCFLAKNNMVLKNHPNIDKNIACGIFKNLVLKSHM